MTEPRVLELQVRLYDGRHPIPHAAALHLSGEQARLSGTGFERRYATAALQVSPRIAGAPRFVGLPDGGELECEDGAWLDSLPQQEPTEGPVAWLERRWWVALAALTMTAIGVVCVYLFALDALCDRAVSAISNEQELRFGQGMLSSFDGQVLHPSTLGDERERALTKLFKRFSADVPDSGHFRLEFRNSEEVGVNAFTFPGGIIVVTDQLVRLMSSDEEVMAVLAHELGHAHYRHVLRLVVRNSGAALAAGALGGDASSVAAGTSAAFALLGAKFSREFESQADDYASYLLQKEQLSPALFGDAFQAMIDDREHSGDREGYSFLSTHPGTAERIAGARAAASALPSQTKALH